MGKWYGPQTGDCSCCEQPCECTYCSGETPQQVLVVVSNLANVDCDDCDAFDGGYVCDCYTPPASHLICNGPTVWGCRWASPCVKIRSATANCAARYATMLVFFGKYLTNYYLEAELRISKNSTCGDYYSDRHRFSRNMGTAHDCAAWNGIALGTLGKCFSTLQAGVQYCGRDPYPATTSMILTAL